MTGGMDTFEEKVLDEGKVGSPTTSPTLGTSPLPRLKDLAAQAAVGQALTSLRLDDASRRQQKLAALAQPKDVTAVETEEASVLLDAGLSLYKPRKQSADEMGAFSFGDLSMAKAFVTPGRQNFMPGTVLKGSQQNNDHRYDVTVDIKSVDFDRARVSGYLTIENLTATLPTLTTFFDGEMVDPAGDHPFLNGQWGSTKTFDLMHWNRFPFFAAHREDFLLQDAGAERAYNPRTSDYIFMRWKERFLVPDHRNASLQGASYAGFYYICYQLSTGFAVGFYFHESSDLFQELNISLQSRKEHQSFDFQ